MFELKFSISLEKWVVEKMHFFFSYLIMLLLNLFKQEIEITYS